MCIRFAALGLLLTVLPVLAQNAPPGKPHYRADASWPQELPNKWIMGQVGGMAIDAQDHIWVLQRPKSAAADLLAAQTPPHGDCCVTTPALLEFDTKGALIKSWTASDFKGPWPASEHALWIDKSGNIWISGNGGSDHQVVKYSPDGQLRMQIGHSGDMPRNNQDTSVLGRVADIFVDDAAHEVYFADGYLNTRVVVYDSENGSFKRGWGAYGAPLDQLSNADDQAPPDQAAKAFNNVHCARMSKDGLIYVCDRHNNRIQVFTREGKFQKEFPVHPATLNAGSATTIIFSNDAKQNTMLVADFTNNVIEVLRRSDGDEVGVIGHSGRNAGQFHGVHQLVQDSHGNLYTGEAADGRRIQKLMPVNN
ncbi:MAG: hypothetical protein NTX21_12605 [Alphaproteobacteria bacterium]|nr:hypothetical protein [Alphaproteobacteria bacterium]